MSLYISRECEISKNEYSGRTAKDIPINRCASCGLNLIQYLQSDSDNPGQVTLISRAANCGDAMKIFCRHLNCKEATIALIWRDRSVLFLRRSHLGDRSYEYQREIRGFSPPRGNRLDRKLDVLHSDVGIICLD